MTRSVASSPYIATDEHVFIPGMTGSGKSVLAEIYLAGFDYVVKLDTKGETSERQKNGKPIWRGLKEGRDFTVVRHLAELDNVETDKIIYEPVFEESELDYYNELMKWVYRRENTTLWIDELMEVAPGPMKYPPYLKALYTRGRSKDVGVWALTQRPSDIPTIAMANSTHFFVFNLNLPQDREKMVKVTGMTEFYELPGKHNFWYYKMGDDWPVRAKLDLERG